MLPSLGTRKNVLKREGKRCVEGKGRMRMRGRLIWRMKRTMLKTLMILRRAGPRGGRQVWVLAAGSDQGWWSPAAGSAGARSWQRARRPGWLARCGQMSQGRLQLSPAARTSEPVPGRQTHDRAVPTSQPQNGRHAGPTHSQRVLWGWRACGASAREPSG